MSKLQGPLIYDSLDKVDADERMANNAPKRENTLGEYIVLVSIGAVLLVILFVYIFRRLEQKAALGDQLAQLTLDAVFTVMAFALLVLICGGVYYGLIYLRRYVKRSGLVSIKDGPHYDVERNTLGLDRRQFDELADKMFAVMLKRAEESRYAGAKTLTVDESTSTTIKQEAPATEDKTVGLDKSNSSVMDDLEEG